MQVYYELLGGEKLCFVHAVKAVMERDEEVTAYAPDVAGDIDDMGGTGYLGVTCCRCFPETEKEVEKIILDLLRAKKKFAAVKAYKDATGTDLRSAKEAVDEYQDRLDEEDDD